MCGGAHSHKNCPNKEKRSPKCANCKGPHVANYKGCPAYKDQAFRQHVVQKQVSYASILKQAPPPPPSNTFNFAADQIISLVTNVVIQVAQPQLCTKNLPEKLVQAKSDLSKQIAETAKKCLGVNIEGKQVFESIISQPAPPPPAPFVFSSTLVEKEKVPLKASTILNKATPSSASSSNITKSTKNPRPKRKELQNYLLENQIDILALNETFLKPKFKFHLPGYDIYKTDRLVGKKGGVAILVKKGIIVNQKWKNDHFNVITDNEALAVEIELQNGDKVILATIYSPNGHPSLRLFRMINALSKQVIFLGDFN